MFKPLQMRILEPHPNVLAFYDGRIPAYRFAQGPNWVDDGALSLGIASYAIVNGASALVYDTHTTPAHAALVRRELEARGVRDITVVLSHWHLDHVAGNEVFGDCPIWSCARTVENLQRHKQAIEAGSYDGPPSIEPLVMPTHTYQGSTVLDIGTLRVRLMEFNIHSDDATVLWLEGDGLLLAGDTLEDTVTYVAEPGSLPVHLGELDRLSALPVRRILPNHGDPDVIAAGGYSPELISATSRYVRALLEMKNDAALRALPLEALLQSDLKRGILNYYAGYEGVHQLNVARVTA